MKTVEYKPGPEGGLTITTTVLERTDPVDYLSEYIGDHKIIDELKYMGLKNLGQFVDEYDDIMKRILDRFPAFFHEDELNLNEAVLKDMIKDIK